MKSTEVKAEGELTVRMVGQDEADVIIVVRDAGDHCLVEVRLATTGPQVETITAACAAAVAQAALQCAMAGVAFKRVRSTGVVAPALSGDIVRLIAEKALRALVAADDVGGAAAFADHAVQIDLTKPGDPPPVPPPGAN